MNGIARVALRVVRLALDDEVSTRRAWFQRGHAPHLSAGLALCVATRETPAVHPLPASPDPFTPRLDDVAARRAVPQLIRWIQHGGNLVPGIPATIPRTQVPAPPPPRHVQPGSLRPPVVGTAEPVRPGCYGEGAPLPALCAEQRPGSRGKHLAALVDHRRRAIDTPGRGIIDNASNLQHLVVVTIPGQPIADPHALAVERDRMLPVDE